MFSKIRRKLTKASKSKSQAIPAVQYALCGEKSALDEVNTTTALTMANNYLAVKLHKLFAAEKCNVFFSPFSISTVMSMLLSGAEGQTETELTIALGHDVAGIQKANLSSIFDEYMTILLQKPDSYTLASANSMLSQKGFEIKDQYKDILNNAFKALLVEADFKKEAHQIVGQINNWVSEKTNGMIPKLVGFLDPDTVMVLLNAIYFKGTWLHKFDAKDTHPHRFYNKGLDEYAKDVDMMNLRDEKFYYTDTGTCQVVQLPYIGEEIAMLILLPQEKDGLNSVEKSLTPDFIQKLRTSMVKKRVILKLPKFRLDYSKGLVSCFRKLGVNRVFSRGAELGILSDSKDLAVSEILHKAVLVVNEEGSEAAAATGMMIWAQSIDPIFFVDHPFAFVIYDTRNDLILFMGRVEEL